MQLLSRARKVHRTEASLHTAYAAGWLVAAAGFSIPVAWGTPWARSWWYAGFVAVTLVISGVIVALELRASRRTRAQIVETPLDLVSDMLLVHERELRSWTGRPALAFSVAVAFCGLTMLGWLQAWGMLALSCVWLGALTYMGIKRTRYLRRELAGLRELRSELE